MLYHAGMIHLSLGDQANAKKHLSEALSINRHFSVRHAEEASRTLQSIH